MLVMCTMGGADLNRDRMEERDMRLAMPGHQQPVSQQPSSQIDNQQQNQSKQSVSTLFSSSTGSRGGNFGKTELVDEFPAGMRVLVVDDDPMCLVILDRMLRQCSYQVTTCGRAAKALDLLRGDRDKFDLVISDVYMPDMDGFKLLELVGLEMDLPVIMMSANGETSAVMKGITHGACDYLLKPVRLEELRNIWQHVVRKKRLETRDIELSTSHDEGGERSKRGGGEDVDYTSSATDTNDGNWKLAKRKKEKEEEEDNEQDNDDPSTLKKPRVVWSVELHQQFVSAVNQLGLDKAVPKRILELMSVHGLTRENVASHLQKYRLYLKRLSGVSNQQNSDSPFGAADSFSMMSSDIGFRDLATFHQSMTARLNPSNGLGQLNGLDSSLIADFSPHPLPRSRMLHNIGGFISSMPRPLDIDPYPQSHHLPHLNPISELPMFKAAHVNSGLGIGSLGGYSGNLVSNPSNEAMMMHQLIRAAQQGGGPSLNLQQADDLGASHILPGNLDVGNANSAAGLSVNVGSAMGLAAMGGPSARGISSPSGTAASLSSSRGSLLPQAPVLDQTVNFVNNGGDSFSVVSSVQLTKSGGACAPPSAIEISTQQDAMRASFNPLTILGHGHTPVNTHNTGLAWLGPTSNPGLGNLGQSMTSGSSSWYSSLSPSCRSGVDTPHQDGQQGHEPYFEESSYPARLALDGRLARPSPSGGSSRSGQHLGDIEDKPVKENRTAENLISVDAEGGLVAHGTSNQEYCGYYIKQAHEEVGSFSEHDLAEEGYNPVDNLYVK